MHTSKRSPRCADYFEHTYVGQKLFFSKNFVTPWVSLIPAARFWGGWGGEVRDQNNFHVFMRISLPHKILSIRSVHKSGENKFSLPPRRMLKKYSGAFGGRLGQNVVRTFLCWPLQGGWGGGGVRVRIQVPLTVFLGPNLLNDQNTQTTLQLSQHSKGCTDTILHEPGNRTDALPGVPVGSSSTARACLVDVMTSGLIYIGPL